MVRRVYLFRFGGGANRTSLSFAEGWARLDQSLGMHLEEFIDEF